MSNRHKYSCCHWVDGFLPALNLTFCIYPWYTCKKNYILYGTFNFCLYFGKNKTLTLLIHLVLWVLQNSSIDYFWFRNFWEGSYITRLGAQICEFWQRAAEERLVCSNLARKELDILKNFYWPVWTGNRKSNHSHRQSAVFSLLTFKCHLVSSESQGNANNRALGKKVIYKGHLLETIKSWFPFLYTSVFVKWNSHSSTVIFLID